MKAIFEFREDQNGNTGLIFQGAPEHFDSINLKGFSGVGFNPAGLIVHDLIEHNFKLDSGSVEDELKAIGAAMYGRGNFGSVTVDGFYNDILFNARECELELKNTSKGSKRFDDIEWMIEELKGKNLIKGIMYELDLDDINRIKKFIQLAFRYIRQGARRAQRRFKTSFNMVNMFEGMQQELLRVGKYIEEYEQLIVSFCFKNLEYSVKIHNPYNFESEY